MFNACLSALTKRMSEALMAGEVDWRGTWRRLAWAWENGGGVSAGRDGGGRGRRAAFDCKRVGPCITVLQSVHGCVRMELTLRALQARVGHAWLSSLAYRSRHLSRRLGARGPARARGGPSRRPRASSWRLAPQGAPQHAAACALVPRGGRKQERCPLRSATCPFPSCCIRSHSALATGSPLCAGRASAVVMSSLRSLRNVIASIATIGHVMSSLRSLRKCDGLTARPCLASD